MEIDFKAIEIAQVVDFRRGSLDIGHTADPGMAENDVFQDGMRGHQHAVLVNHADAVVNGVQGGFKLHRLAGHVDLAFVRLVLPEEDFHQRGFAGAVLTQDGVNFPRPDRKVDPVIGQHRAESLGDSPRL